MDRRVPISAYAFVLFWKDLRAGRGLSVPEPGRKPYAGGKLGMASRMAIGECEPDLD